MEVIYTNNLLNKSKKIGLYVFTVCNNIEKIIKILKVNFGIKSVPKSFLKSDDLFKRLYFDNYEILFIFMKKKCNHKTLYESFGILGKELNNYEQNIAGFPKFCFGGFIHAGSTFNHKCLFDDIVVFTSYASYAFRS